MGYTNYWQRPHTLGPDDPEKFKRFSSDCRLILQAVQVMGIDIFLYERGSEPITNDNKVEFSDGVYEICAIPKTLGTREAERAAHLGITNGLYFQFCKTLQRPYDLAVKAVLLALQFHFPEVTIDCDKSSNLMKPGEDWKQAKSLFLKIGHETRI